MKKPFSLNKNERLKSKKTIDTLFQNGKAYFVFPFTIKYNFPEEPNREALQFGVSVPKRFFKKAVIRNKIKRRFREAYRIQKNILKEKLIAQNKQIAIMFIYTHQEIISYQEIENAVKKILEKMIIDLN